MPNRGRQTTLLMADVQAGSGYDRVRVKDISAGGVKVVGLAAGAASRIRIQLPRIGWIAGTVAWVRGELSGIAFDDKINPAAVRQPVTGSYTAPVPGIERQLRNVA